mgnify:CR=1 FL=1
MVAADYLDRGFEKGFGEYLLQTGVHLPEHPFSDEHMGLHRFSFIVGERPGFVQNQIGDSYFADVVQGCEPENLAQQSGFKAPHRLIIFAGHDERIPRHPDQVLACFIVLLAHEGYEGPRRFGNRFLKEELRVQGMAHRRRDARQFPGVIAVIFDIFARRNKKEADAFITEDERGRNAGEYSLFQQKLRGNRYFARLGVIRKIIDDPGVLCSAI